MSKVCQITGKRVITGNNVSHSKRRTRRTFEPNLFSRKFYDPENDNWVKLKVSAKGIRIINKKGLANAMKEAKAKGFM
jgi:large subunit ribosomal protein L28